MRDEETELIDELFSDWFWYYIWCGYSRENACRMAARRVMSLLVQDWGMAEDLSGDSSCCTTTHCGGVS